MNRRKECGINRRKSYICSMNFILCGCFGARHDCPEVKNAPIEKSNSELLPSSAIASMERLKLIGSSGFSPSPASALDCSTVACPQINLPSSVLLTHACLSHNKANDKLKIDKSDGSKFTKPARLPFRLRRGKQRIKGNGFTVSNDKEDQIVEPASGDETADDNDLQHTLVFSPLPSQIVPDVVVEKQSNATLLGPRSETDKGKKCFVIDLDETLVHSSFKIVDNADFKVGVEIDGITHRVYVLKRPHVDTFLSRMANLYECVLFTASLAKYADPVADFLDKWCTFRFRLFRESCVYHRGNYVKDLSLLGRPINQIVILDNSPASYMFHASHAVQISSWFDDPHDRVLLDLIPYFENLAAHPNVEDFLRSNPSPTPFAAVGTVGLPLTALPQMPLVSDLAGRSADGGTIISNIRRPTVASPLPTSTVSSEPNKFRDDYRRSLVTQSNAMKHVNPRTLPVINKLSSTGTGPSIRKSYPNQEGTNSHASFPTPLSLATYVPISSSTTPVAISKPTSGTTTQAFVPIASNNSNAVSLTTVPVSNNSPNFSQNISHPSSSSMTFSTTITSSSPVYQPRTVRTTNQRIESSKTVWSNNNKLPVTSVRPLSPITACATTVSPSISVTQRPASCQQKALP